jgi:Flp pilus assembly pilin Flp
MPHMHTTRRRLNLSHESGQTLTEYSLLVVLIAIVVAVMLPGVATAISGLLAGFDAAVGG